MHLEQAPPRAPFQAPHRDPIPEDDEVAPVTAELPNSPESIVVEETQAPAASRDEEAPQSTASVPADAKESEPDATWGEGIVDDAAGESPVP